MSEYHKAKGIPIDWMPNDSPLKKFTDKIAMAGMTDLTATYKVVSQILNAEKFCQQTVDELERARLAIMERGWVQGKALDVTTGAVCALGSLQLASANDVARYRVLSEVLSEFLVIELGGRGVAGIPSWNDDPKRTQQEVLDLIHKCSIWVKGKIDG